MDGALPAKVKEMRGGTIVIPHRRRAIEYWEALQNSQKG
jgi:hypothetical protein